MRMRDMESVAPVGASSSDVCIGHMVGPKHLLKEGLTGETVYTRKRHTLERKEDRSCHPPNEASPVPRDQHVEPCEIRAAILQACSALFLHPSYPYRKLSATRRV
jgi:hypothetical protein